VFAMGECWRQRRTKLPRTTIMGWRQFFDLDSSNPVLEGHCHTVFSSNTDQTCIPATFLWLWRAWLGLALNSAGQWPSRTGFGKPWFKGLLNLVLQTGYHHPPILSFFYLIFFLKGLFTKKWIFCQYLLTLMLFQPRKTFVHLQNTN